MDAEKPSNDISKDPMECYIEIFTMQWTPSTVRHEFPFLRDFSDGSIISNNNELLEVSQENQDFQGQDGSESCKNSTNDNELENSVLEDHIDDYIVDPHEGQEYYDAHQDGLTSKPISQYIKVGSQSVQNSTNDSEMDTFQSEDYINVDGYILDAHKDGMNTILMSQEYINRHNNTINNASLSFEDYIAYGNFGGICEVISTKAFQEHKDCYAQGWRNRNITQFTETNTNIPKFKYVPDLIIKDRSTSTSPQIFGQSHQFTQLSIPQIKRQKTSSIIHSNCKKSHCQKLYCECFAAGELCGQNCNCQDCYNRWKYENRVILERKNNISCHNPLAINIVDQEKSGRGCNCTKSMCKNGYCTCHKGQLGCSSACRCEGCDNSYGNKKN